MMDENRSEDILRHPNPRSILWVFLLLTLSMSGIFIIKETTSHGAGLRPDSFTYLSAAENIVEGRGYASDSGPEDIRPVTNFPPLYSYSIALILRSGLEVYPSARVLTGILFGLTLISVGITLVFITRSYLWSLYGTSLVLTSPVLIELYSYAQSEPLYLWLSVLGLMILAFYISRRKHLSVLAVASLIIGGAALTRYIGVSLILAGYLALLLGIQTTGKRKWLSELSIYGLFSFVPILLFLARNALVAGNVANRPSPYWHPPGFDQWIHAGNTFLGWFIPTSSVEKFSTWLGWALFTLLSTLITLLLMQTISKINRSHGIPRADKAFLVLSSSYFLLYGLFLLVTVLIFDVLTPLDNRLMSPLLLNAYMVVIPLVSSFWNKTTSGWRVFILILSVFFIGNNTYQSELMIPYLRATPQGYASPVFQSSPTLEYLRELPDTKIFSNNIPALYFWADIKAVAIPSRMNPYDQRDEDLEKYYSDLNDMRRSIKAEEALLVIFGTNPQGRVEHEQWVELTDGLTVIIEFVDGIIFGSQDIERLEVE